MDKSTKELLAQAEKLCAQRNVRLTPQRLEVLRLMSLQQGAISAYDLLDLLRESDVYSEQHAVVALDRYASFSLPWYDTADKQASVAYQGMAMVSVLNVVSQTQLVAIAPRWLAEEFSDSLSLQILPLPLKLNSRTCYLSWHEAAGRDKGHQWMEELLVNICRR